MQFTEQPYERKALLDLPPNARDLAELLLNRYSLKQLLALQAAKMPPQFELKMIKEHRTELSYWPTILQATVLAKTTHFVASEALTQPHILYLLKLACANAGYALSKHSLVDVIEYTKQDMAVLNKWLITMRDLLLEKKKTA